MEYLCTICCQKKRKDSALLPAIERYISKRIEFVVAESRGCGRPLLILSGKYGLLEPHQRIPWYDQALAPEAVDALLPKVARQLADRGATAVILYARPKSTPGWRPYYDVLEKACEKKGVFLEIRELDPEVV